MTFIVIRKKYVETDKLINFYLMAIETHTFNNFQTALIYEQKCWDIDFDFSIYK